MLTLLVIFFTLGYLAIAFEQVLQINKSAVALFTAVVCWSLYLVYEYNDLVIEQLEHHLGKISEILFFLLGAMTIVELIDIHDGFSVITRRISTSRQLYLLWIVCGLSFFLSSILDNLTTTIVLISVLRKLVYDANKRLIFVGMVIIAANAGGAWSPIGDVTTTMLWVGHQVSAGSIMMKLFLPSLVSLLVPLLIASFQLRGMVERSALMSIETSMIQNRQRNWVFLMGVASLLFVPVFKILTHLPPYMGVLFGLSIIWITTEIRHKDDEEKAKDAYSVSRALQRIDVPSVLFFLGILLTVAVLQSAGLLVHIAQWVDAQIHSQTIVAAIIGLLSAVVDNVPLVAATMGMYDLHQYPQDSYLWEMIAYCAGTGGSILIIGSAAGIAAMGMEKISFSWYLKHVSWLALIGYISGIFVYVAMN